jgi:hypothetical protein
MSFLPLARLGRGDGRRKIGETPETPGSLNPVGFDTAYGVGQTKIRDKPFNPRSVSLFCVKERIYVERLMSQGIPTQVAAVQSAWRVERRTNSSTKYL